MSIKNLLSTAFSQSVISLNNRLFQDENQQTSSATYLGNNQVQFANGDIRKAYNQGTKDALIGESVTVTFPLHSQIGFYSTKIS
jgi:hypothetical protein